MNQFFQIGGQCRETVVESLHPYALMCRSENSPHMLRGPLIGDNWPILLLASRVFSRWDTSHGFIVLLFPLIFCFCPKTACSGAWKATWAIDNNQGISREDSSNEPAEVCLQCCGEVFNFWWSFWTSAPGRWDAWTYWWEWTPSGWLSLSTTFNYV